MTKIIYLKITAYLNDPMDSGHFMFRAAEAQTLTGECFGSIRTLPGERIGKGTHGKQRF